MGTITGRAGTMNAGFGGAGLTGLGKQKQGVMRWVGTMGTIGTMFAGFRVCARAYVNMWTLVRENSFLRVG